MMVETSVSKALVKRAVADYFSALRALDPEAWVSTFDSGGVRFDPDGTPFEGRLELRKLLEGIREAAEWMDVHEDLVLVSGDGAAVKWSGRFRPRGGADAPIEGIEVFEVGADGKIRSVWSYRDTGDLVTNR